MRPPFTTGTGTLQGVFAAARDVTERKRLDQVLQDKNAELESARSVAEKANLAKSDFLSSMSHELRSPLNAILGFAQLMESADPLPTVPQAESIAQILQAGWHLLKLINEILDLAAIESEGVAVVGIGVVVRGHVRMPGHDGTAGATARDQHDLSTVRRLLVRHGRPDPLEADCHQPAFQRDQIQQGGGNDHRGLHREHPERIRISVADTGAGLPPESWRNYSSRSTGLARKPAAWPARASAWWLPSDWPN